MSLKFFATTPKGLELLLVEELKSLGAQTAAEKLAGVVFSGDLSVAYKACLHSRLANRILLPIAQVPANSPEELYQGVQTINWDDHLDISSQCHAPLRGLRSSWHPENKTQENKTIYIHFISSQSEITHTLYGAQKVKDAIVDQIREKYNLRPSVAKENPDLSIHVYLHRNIANISIDLSGESLHKRGIRIEAGIAPLKENLAAAILMRAGWNKIAKEGGMLLDPMCGSGTFLIEAAQMAGNIAPGLSRNYFGFLGWKKHDATLWENLVAQANQQITLDKIPKIMGYDHDPKAIKIAFANIERAGLLGKIHVEKKDLNNPFSPSQTSSRDLFAGSISGLIVTNPPYGERLGDIPELKKLYEALGNQLKNNFVGWQAAVFTGNKELAKNMGIRSHKQYALFNGAIPCQLLLFDIQPQRFMDRSPEAINEKRILKAQSVLSEKDQESIKMLVNRIQKNFKHLKKWAEREKISCYRIYDADLPEYAVSIDLFSIQDSSSPQIIVKEYLAPKSIDSSIAEKRLQSVLAVLPETLNISSQSIYLHATFPESEYSPDFSKMEVVEEPVVIPAKAGISRNYASFLINIKDPNYEVGLKLQERNVRKYILKHAKNKNVLNLFCGTATITIAAALGDCRSSTSVDSSDFLLDWAEENFMLNNISSKQHRLIKDNVIDWVSTQKSRYDLIFAELPFDARRKQEDYKEFIIALTRLLDVNGIILLTAKNTKFKPPALTHYPALEITKNFLMPDFSKESKLQKYWKIEAKK